MLVRAPLLDAPTPGELRFVRDGALVIDAGDGTLLAAGEHNEVRTRFPGAPEFVPPRAGRLLAVPGLIDTHAHLPQYPAVARREASLLPWLENHIFPLEREFRGEAQRAFISAFFDEVLRNGTTTIVLYSAIWEDSTALAFEVAKEKGIRAVIGKMMMDEGSYGESDPIEARELSIAQCRELITKWHRAGDGLLDFVVSPRFAVTCSMALMQEAAALALEHDTYIQTHLSENHLEIEAVRQRFPEAASYTEVYDRAGLLTAKTLLGHCLHLNEEEIELIAQRQSRVTHCPTSNLFLNSGLIPLDRIRDAGIPVSLGSDVAAGTELNLWQVMRSAIEVQKARSFTEAGIPELTPTHAFHLATAAGAEVLHKTDRIGTLDAGKDADFTLLDLDAVLPLGGSFTPPDLTPEQILTACIYRGHPAATVATFVRGRRTG